MKLLFESWRRYINEQEGPGRNTRDELEAVAHLNNEEGEEDKYSRDDFETMYYGELYADDLASRLDETTEWLVLDPADFKQFWKPTTRSFDTDAASEYLSNKVEFDRGEFENRMDFIDRAMEWVEAGELPPVYMIQNSEYKDILGDGRGRLNIARAFGLKVPVYYMRLMTRGGQEQEELEL